jgi:hypothetical protein
MPQSEWEKRREREAKAQLQKENIAYRDQLARQRAAETQAARDTRTADGIIASARNEAQKTAELAIKDAENSAASVAKDAAAQERAILGAAVTRRTGATSKNRKATPVYHWKAVLPDDPDIPTGGAPAGFGPLLFLPPGGGIRQGLFAPRALARKFPKLRKNNAAFEKWSNSLPPILAEAEKRYPILEKLRNDEWFSKFAESTGIAIKNDPRTDYVQGTYGQVERKVTVYDIPTLTGVRVDQSGLVLTFKHRAGDTAEKWGKCISVLRAGFKNAGVSADRLRVTETHSGDIQLVFDDAPSVFPKAIAPEPPERPAGSKAEAIARYPSARWVLGVDARGNVIDTSIKAFPHVLVVGSTGGGKSTWARGMLESLRVSGWMLFIGDGKGSDYVSLTELPNVVMVSPSSDPAQHVILVHRVRVEMERRFEQAAAAKRAGKADTAFNYPPIVLLLDEFAFMRQRVQDIGGKEKDAFFANDVEVILRLGREVRVHAVLSSQDLYVDTVPGSWQDNLHMVVSLGQPSPRTMLSGAFPEALKPVVQRIGDRITKSQQGRGIFVNRERDSVVEFQSYFGWSPGSTTLSQAPTPEVRTLWERWIPVSENAPRLYPRVGIKADDHGWREGTLAEVAQTPTVALDDANGAIPGRSKDDPWSDAWVGARAALDTSGHEDLDLDAAGSRLAWVPAAEAKQPKPEPEPEPEPEQKTVTQPPEPGPGLPPEQLAALLARLTPEQHDTVLSQMLRRPVGGDPEPKEGTVT